MRQPEVPISKGLPRNRCRSYVAETVHSDGSWTQLFPVVRKSSDGKQSSRPSFTDVFYWCSFENRTTDQNQPPSTLGECGVGLGWAGKLWSSRLRPLPQSFAEKRCVVPLQQLFSSTFHFSIFIFLKRPSVGVYDRVSRFYDIPVCASRFYRSPCYVVCVHGLLSLELASALQRRWLPYFKQTQNCWNVFSTISAYKLFYLKSLIAQTSNAVSFTLLFFQKLKLYVSFRILKCEWDIHVTFHFRPFAQIFVILWHFLSSGGMGGHLKHFVEESLFYPPRLISRP